MNYSIEQLEVLINGLSTQEGEVAKTLKAELEEKLLVAKEMAEMGGCDGACII